MTDDNDNREPTDDDEQVEVRLTMDFLGDAYSRRFVHEVKAGSLAPADPDSATGAELGESGDYHATRRQPMPRPPGSGEYDTGKVGVAPDDDEAPDHAPFDAALIAEGYRVDPATADLLAEFTLGARNVPSGMRKTEVVQAWMMDDDPALIADRIGISRQAVEKIIAAWVTFKKDRS